MLGRRKKAATGDEPVLGSKSKEMKNTQDDVGEILAEIDRLKKGPEGTGDNSYKKKPGEVVPELKSAQPANEEKISAKMLFSASNEITGADVKDSQVSANLAEPEVSMNKSTDSNKSLNDVELKPSFESMERPSVESMIEEQNQQAEIEVEQEDHAPYSHLSEGVGEKLDSGQIKEDSQSQASLPSNDVNNTVNPKITVLPSQSLDSPVGIRSIDKSSNSTPAHSRSNAVGGPAEDSSLGKTQSLSLKIAGDIQLNLEFEASGKTISISTAEGSLFVNTSDGAQLCFPLKNHLKKAS